MRRLVTAVLGMTALIAVPSTPAFAGNGGGWATDGNGAVSVGVGVPGSPGGSSASPSGHGATPDSLGSSGGGNPACATVPMPPGYEAEVGPGGPTPGEWEVVECDANIPFDLPGGWTVAWFPSPTGGPSNPAPPQIDPAVLAQQAESEVHLPSPVIKDNPASNGWVNLAEWFWLDPTTWHAYSATASVSGISATATATPTQVSWRSGDGGSFVCDGPGRAYDTSIPPQDQSSDCTWTYRKDSAGQPGDAYQLSATVSWSVSWTTNAPSGGASLPGLSTTATTSLPVYQVEAVNTN